MITFASIIGILYLLLVVAMCVIAGVVVYHIMSYSLRTKYAFFGSFFFIIVFFILLGSNILLFNRIDWAGFAARQDIQFMR